MNAFRCAQCPLSLLGMLLVLSVAMMPAAMSGQTGTVDSDAKQLLSASMTYLAGRKSFSVDAHSTLEVVLTSGQKIQFDHAATVSVQRPDKLRAERHGDLVEQVLYYDGSTVSLHNPADKVFATLPAPGTLEEMLDFTRESLDVVAPGTDLIYRNAYDILMDDVRSGFVVGKSVVDGVSCDHLAFRSLHVDWQIWIQDGSEPLPKKLVITTRDVVNAPQFAVTMTRWNLSPVYGEETFVFSPPPDAQKIDFLPVGDGGDSKSLELWRNAE